MGMHAYRRDPYSLFAPTRADESWSHAPMNEAFQPVRYMRPRLLVTLEPFQQGTVVEQATVHWDTGLVRLFENTEDAACDVATHESLLRVPLPLRTTEEYANELEQLLLRGHGLHMPHCTCRHSLSDDRCRELGVHRAEASEEVCAWPKRVVERTLSEVQVALAVQASSQLELCALFRGDSRFEWGPCGVRLARFCEDDIRSEAELVCGLRLKGHSGLLLPLKLSSKEAEEGLARLLKKGTVLCLQQELRRLAFLNVQPHLRIDSDLRDLWHSFA